MITLNCRIQSRNVTIDAVMFELMRGNMAAAYGSSDTQCDELIGSIHRHSTALFETVTSRGKHILMSQSCIG